MYPKQAADTSAGAEDDESDPDTAQDEIEANLGHSERFEDNGLRIRSKGRGKFAYFVGRTQITELGYIDIKTFSDEERQDYEQRRQKHQQYKNAAAKARADWGSAEPRA
jgi:hypothetical protein